MYLIVIAVCRYAREDTHYLLYIYDLMRLRLVNGSSCENDLLLEVFFLLVLHCPFFPIYCPTLLDLLSILFLWYSPLD